jgi:hypothetical protein
MVAQGGIAPEAVLHPEDAVNQGIVLLGCARLDPGVGQTREGMEFRSGNMRFIIPDRLSVPCGVVSE